MAGEGREEGESAVAAVSAAVGEVYGGVGGVEFSSVVGFYFLVIAKAMS